MNQPPSLFSGAFEPARASKASILQRSPMPQEDSSTLARLCAHDTAIQWVFVTAGLSWYRIFRDSGGYLAFFHAAIQTEHSLRRKD
jgi:hypothetical protein